MSRQTSTSRPALLCAAAAPETLTAAAPQSFALFLLQAAELQRASGPLCHHRRRAGHLAARRHEPRWVADRQTEIMNERQKGYASGVGVEGDSWVLSPGGLLANPKHLPPVVG